jgi:diguanylate cyclase
VDQRQEFVRTIAFGEAAIGHMRAGELPAYPRNYELWYTYSAGYNPALNRSINDMMADGRSLSSDEIDRVYDQFLSPLRFGDRVEHIGGKLSTELRALLSSIDSASSDASSYGRALAGASTDIAAAATDSRRLKAIAETLLAETGRMESRNRELEKSLAQSKEQIDGLQMSLEAIRNESLTDPLTSLGNRKCFDHALLRQFEAMKEEGRPFTLLLTDIDHFKKFNDTYGHQTGDQVLRLVATALKNNVKGQDIAARYGGEEFGVVLPRTTLDQASKVAEHIRESVMQKELIKRSTGARLGRITISIGVACARLDDDPGSLIDRADRALYLAKHMGRNRVCTEIDVEAQDAAKAVA